MKLTEKEIRDCNDIEQLERWVAEVCEGLEWVGENQCFGYYADYFDIDGNRPFTEVEYQPCHDTDLGRSQCWQLADKYGLTLVFEQDGLEVLDGDIPIIFGNPQIAVVKAALLSAREMSDE